MGDLVAKVSIGAVIALGIGAFLKSAWDDAQKQAEETANPPYRWTDKNRWE